jgi:hypothetical protein
MGIVLLIRNMSEKSASVIDCTHYIHKAILCSGSNDVHHIREEVLNTLEGQIKINVGPILSMSSGKIYFPVQFQAIFNVFLVIS